MAKRYESFCKGISFSARPVKINERVCVKFSEISNNWSGVIRFGFTYNDPATLRNSLPKYACPDLTNRAGYWAKALNERFCERDNILFYYVTAAGDVHFGVNGEEKGVFITGVDTRSPLWTLIDIYGNCTAIEFLDSRVCMYHLQHHQTTVRRAVHPAAVAAATTSNGEPAEVERMQNAFQSMNMANEELPQQIVTRPLPAQQQQQTQCNENSGGGGGLVPLPFHRTKGRNVMLSADRMVATRADSEFCQGYVFTARPLKIGEKIIVQILRTEHMYVGALALGLTSCDPATLQSIDLPDDSDILLDRPEYWVVSKDVAATPNRGDEIMFCVTAGGEVQISKNRGPPSVVMHVDQSLQLWAFLDVYGSTQSVRILSQSPPAPVPMSMMSPSRRAGSALHVQMPTSESINSLNSQVSMQQLQLAQNQQIEMQQQRQAVAAAAAAAAAATCGSSRVINVPSQNGDLIQIQPGGTVLVVNLPPTHSSLTDLAAAAQQHQLQQQQQQNHVQQCSSSRLSVVPSMATATTTVVPAAAATISQSSSATLISNYSNSTYIEVSLKLQEFVFIQFFLMHFFIVVKVKCK